MFDDRNTIDYVYRTFCTARDVVAQYTAKGSSCAAASAVVTTASTAVTTATSEVAAAPSGNDCTGDLGGLVESIPAAAFHMDISSSCPPSF